MPAGETRAAPHVKPGILALAWVPGLVLLALWLARLAVRAVALQWDFRVYLAAARAAQQGLDPYRVENLAHVAGRPVALPFLYPPAALLPFLALSALPVPVACALWMALKAAILVALVVLWRREFAPETGWLAIALLALLGSNAAVVADLRSGNVGLIEAGLLWAGFASYLRGRSAAFAAWVVAAALFKLQPAAFLLLLLVPTRSAPARPRLFLAAALALALLALGPLALAGPVFGAPWRLGGWLAALGGPFPVGEANPSAYALALAWLRGRVAHPEAAALVPWAAWTGLVLWAGVRALAPGRGAHRARSVVAAAVALFLLVSPRPMAYGFVLGGGALAFLVARAGRTALERGGLVLLVAAQGAFTLAGTPWTGTLLAHATLLAWAALGALCLARGGSGDVQTARGETRADARADAADAVRAKSEP